MCEVLNWSFKSFTSKYFEIEMINDDSVKYRRKNESRDEMFYRTAILSELRFN